MTDIDAVIVRQIAVLREAFRNDGLEGETVHAVCAEVERLRATLAELDEAGALSCYAQHTVTQGDTISVFDCGECVTCRARAALARTP